MPHLEERLSAWGLLASPFDKRILIGGEWGRGSHGAISIAAASRGAQAPGSSGSAGASIVWSLCRVWSEAGCEHLPDILQKFGFGVNFFACLSQPLN